MSEPLAPGTSRESLLRRALRLDVFLIIYNLLEAGASVAFGILAGSIALLGFGLDSVIEVVAASIMIWRLRLERRGLPFEKAEHRAHFLIGLTFFALAAYIAYETVERLIAGESPDVSIPGIVIASLSLLIMPGLGLAKLRISRKLESRALRADAMETLVCSDLSLALLLGLTLNALAGWWWAVPVAALAMIPLMLKEGWEGVRGEGCCKEGYLTNRGVGPTEF